LAGFDTTPTDFPDVEISVSQCVCELVSTYVASHSVLVIWCLLTRLYHVCYLIAMQFIYS